MEATAHTPGPWVLCNNGEIKAQNNIGLRYDYVCRMPFDSLAEAEEMGPSQLPNAHLIAAAPELLDACRLVLCAFRLRRKIHGNPRPSNLEMGIEALIRRAAA
jgi:hypothetical protein